MKSIWISLKHNEEDIQTIHITAFYKVIFLRTDYMGKQEEFYSFWEMDKFESQIKSHLLKDDLTFNEIKLSIEENDSRQNFSIDEKTEVSLKAPLLSVIGEVNKWHSDNSPENIIPAIRITWTQTKPTEKRSVLIFPWPQYYGYQQLVNGLAEFVISNSQDNKSFFVKDIHKLETDYYKAIKGQLSIMKFLPGQFEIDIINPANSEKDDSLIEIQPLVTIGEMKWNAREYGDDPWEDKRNRLHNHHQTGFAADWASQEFNNVMSEFYRLFNNDIPFVKENPLPKGEIEDYDPIELSSYDKAIRVEMGYEKEFSIVTDNTGFLIDTNFKLLSAKDLEELFSILESKYFNDETIGIIMPERIRAEVYKEGNIIFEDSYAVYHDDFAEFCEEHDNEKCNAELSRMIQESFNLVKELIENNL